MCASRAPEKSLLTTSDYAHMYFAGAVLQATHLRLLCANLT